jgi:DNA-3-methyladenine glycosylase
VTLGAALEGSAVEVAQALLGWTLLVDSVGGVIVETEAYTADDPASHSSAGRTDRNASMFAAAGTLYVYRSYGVHWCANVASGAVGEGAAVLLRALEPTQGLDVMRERRGRTGDDRALCAGPGRLAQALGIDASFDGLRLDADPFALRAPAERLAIAATPRIGISKAVDRPWRFVVRGSRWVSAGPRPA